MDFKQSDSLILIHQSVPYWKSSRLIRQQILALWSEFSHQVCSVNFNKISWEGLELKQNYKKIVFCESSPHPQILLGTQLPFDFEEVIFHIYGNFTQLLPEWLKLFDSLKGKRIALITASEAEKELIKGLLGKESEQNISVVYYPISFKEDETANSDYWPKAEEEKWLVYAGRISLQKNPRTLIDCIERFFTENPGLLKNTRIYFAGEIDDIGFPHGPSLLPGHFFQSFQNRLNQLPPDIRNRLRFTGHLSQARLKSLFQNADAAISLSTFHDEDFGYAALQALAEGCPVILSNWGGHKDFLRRHADFSHIVGLDLTNDGIMLKYPDFEKAIRQILTSEHGQEERRKCMTSIRETYSVKTLAKELQKVSPKKASFTIPLHTIKFCEKILNQRKSKTPPFSSISSEDKLYTQIYSPFIFSQDSQ